MEIIDNKALIVRTRNPDKITNYIKNSRYLKQLPETDVHEVLVHWTLPNTKILHNIGISKAPAPIMGQYHWPGLYTPYEHQKITAGFLTLHQKSFCFNQQGTGKTCSVAWAADYLMNKGIISRVLIVCPLSIMASAWQSDLFKTVMHRSVDIAHGPKAKREAIIRSNAEFVIINHDGVEVVKDTIAKGGFDLIVVDECNVYKNQSSNRWRVLNSLVKPETWLWLLTGTPAAQSPLDAYGLAKLVNPQAVPNFYGAWRDRVMTKVTTFKYVPKPNAEQLVHQVLQPAIRFTKEECLDLPELVYSNREVPLTTQQKKYYDLLKKQMLIEAGGEEVSAVNAAVMLGKLLQISAGSAYSDNREVIEFDCSARLNELLQVIEEASHKTLVFVNYRHSIELVRSFLESKNISCDVVHGGVSSKKRTDVFKRFQELESPQVLVIQPQSAAHGVTLTAADNIVWWGPITQMEYYLQANARIHRAGQKHSCSVVHLMGSEVEKKLYKALESKSLDQTKLLELYKQEIGE